MRLGLMRLKHDQGGGAERTLELLARGLLARGHQVHALTTRWQGQPPAGLMVHTVPAQGRGAARLRSFGEQALQVLNGLDLDTCLSLERVPGSPVFRAGDGCHAAWLARRAPYESLLKRLSFRLNPLHRAQLDLERRTLTSPALRRVVANSRLVARELEQYYGLGDGLVSVIYNGVDEVALRAAAGEGTRKRTRRALGLDGQRPALLFLGAGFERKGLAFALRALAELPEAWLLVAGRGRTAAYERLAKHLGVARRVRFLGQRQDAPQLLAAADAMVLPTIYDPCANACLEALCLGTPVVTTLANGAAELVEEGISGALVPEPADAQALAAACRRALALTRPVPHGVSGQDGWLTQIEAVLQQAAQDGAQ